GRGEHAFRFVVRGQHADDAAAVAELHAAHARGLATHGPHVALLEAYRLAFGGEEHHIVFAIGQRGTNEEVALFQADSDDAARARARELIERRLLYRAVRGRHEDEVLLV